MKTKNQHGLVYLRSPDYLKQVSKADYPDYITENEAEQQALESLKAELKKFPGIVCREYAKPEDISQLVLDDLLGQILKVCLLLIYLFIYLFICLFLLLFACLFVCLLGVSLLFWNPFLYFRTTQTTAFSRYEPMFSYPHLLPFFFEN